MRIRDALRSMINGGGTKTLMSMIRILRPVALAGLFGVAALTADAEEQAPATEQTQEQEVPPQSTSEAPASSTTLDTVIVTGQRPYDRRNLEDVIIPDFVRSHGKTTKIGQLARWRLDVCPSTLGLEATANEFVSARVKEIAGLVGGPVKEPCEHNVQITFTTEPQRLLDEYARRAYVVLGYHFIAQRERLKAVKRPIQAWYATATRSESGFVAVDSPIGVSIPGSPGSRLSNGLSSEFAYVLVVVDLSKLEGNALGPIADYIAMLVLSQPGSLEDCSDLPSILDLLSSTCTTRPKPVEISDADKTYLKALYRTDLRNFVNFERGNISDAMRREIGSR